MTDSGPGPARNGTPPGDGHGIVGMRERVRVHDGDLRTGARRDNVGFEVAVTLPLDGVR